MTLESGLTSRSNRYRALGEQRQVIESTSGPTSKLVIHENALVIEEPGGTRIVAWRNLAEFGTVQALGADGERIECAAFCWKRCDPPTIEWVTIGGFKSDHAIMGDYGMPPTALAQILEDWRNRLSNQ